MKKIILGIAVAAASIGCQKISEGGNTNVTKLDPATTARYSDVEQKKIDERIVVDSASTVKKTAEPVKSAENVAAKTPETVTPQNGTTATAKPQTGTVTEAAKPVNAATTAGTTQQTGTAQPAKK